MNSSSSSTFLYLFLRAFKHACPIDDDAVVIRSADNSRSGWNYA